MDPALVKAAFDALIAEDAAAALEILKKLLETTVTGEPAAEPEAAPENAAEDAPAEEPKDEMLAASRALVSLVGAASPGEAVSKVRELVAAAERVAADRAALEASERRGLVTKLVALGVETPATAWVDPAAEGDKRQPKKRLADEPIAEMRERVIALGKARTNANARPAVAATAGESDRVIKTSRGEVSLSAREIKNCESQGVKLESYAENKAIREAARNSGKR